MSQSAAAQVLVGGSTGTFFVVACSGLWCPSSEGRFRRAWGNMAGPDDDVWLSSLPCLQSPFDSSPQTELSVNNEPHFTASHG